MNYKEKLMEAYRRVRCLPNRNYELDRVEQLLSELVEDKDLIMVNKNCLPVKYEKVREKNFFGETVTTYKAGLNLRITKDIDNCAVLSEEFEKQIAEELKDNLYYYLETQDKPQAFEEFEIHRFDFNSFIKNNS